MLENQTGFYPRHDRAYKEGVHNLYKFSVFWFQVAEDARKNATNYMPRTFLAITYVVLSNKQTNKSGSYNTVHDALDNRLHEKPCNYDGK